MKIHYSQWQKDKLKAVNSLRFDPSNPRIRDVKGGEKAIIKALAESEKLDDLLKKIEQFGWAPIERLVVIMDGTKPIVIEGNRRLAVFKMLLDPEKSPKSLANLVKRARNSLGDSELPRKVACDIPRDAAEASVYAYMKHADEKFSINWAPIQQAIFIKGEADKADAGENPVDDFSPSEIRDARAMVELYRLAGILSRERGSKITTSQLRDFPYEAVKRVFLAKEIGKEIGVEAHKHGLTITGDMNEFLSFYRKTLEKMHEGRATRVFSSNEDTRQWIKESGFVLKGADKKPLRKQVEELDARQDVDNKPEPQANPPIAPKPTKQPVDRRKNKLFPGSSRILVGDFRSQVQATAEEQDAHTVVFKFPEPAGC